MESYMIHNNLFISNFKKYGARIAGIVFTVILLYGGVSFLNYIYFPTNEIARKLMHDYYEFEGSIDNLTLGSSHVFKDVNPWQLDELNGMVNYNLSYDGMQLMEVYYLLEEVIQDHDLKSVNIEMYYSLQMLGTERKWLWPLFDSLKWSELKMELLQNGFEKEECLDTLFPFLRYRSKLFDLEHINEVINTKLSDEYKNYEIRSEEDVEYYNEILAKGFRDTNYMLNEGTLKASSVATLYEEMILPETTELYLGKIIRLCQEEGIKVTLFCSPQYDLQLLGENGYDYYHAMIDELAKEYEVSFYDFNLVKDEYFDSSILKYHSDDDHLNSFGAEAFTEAFHTVLNSENPSSYFYETYEDKMNAREPGVYGLIMGDEFITITSNQEDMFEYRVTHVFEDLERELIQDFDPNTELVIDEREGFLEIEYRLIGDKEEVNTLRINLE